VFYGSAATEAPACADEDVYVVGGANSAGQAAVFLSRHARRVTMLVRADGLERSMSHYLIRQIRDTANIEVRPNTQVVAAAGSEHLERLRLCDTAGGTEEEVATGFLFVFIGAAPCTDWLHGVVQRDPYYLEASVPGVFAAGDARASSVKRVASAVGEGAMAIQLVHRYLEAQ
jgi:thioredoxin reductase (NADPH)